MHKYKLIPMQSTYWTIVILFRFKDLDFLSLPHTFESESILEASVFAHIFNSVKCRPLDDDFNYHQESILHSYHPERYAFPSFSVVLYLYSLAAFRIWYPVPHRLRCRLGLHRKGIAFVNILTISITLVLVTVTEGRRLVVTLALVGDAIV